MIKDYDEIYLKRAKISLDNIKAVMNSKEMTEDGMQYILIDDNIILGYYNETEEFYWYVKADKYN